jgi:hypothetical protein
MNEPIYEFKKGQGWVLCMPGRVITLLDGVRVRVEKRMPVPGERYVAFGDPSYDHVKWLEGNYKYCWMSTWSKSMDTTNTVYAVTPYV